MKFCTYTSTPGLNHFPVQERFRVWRHAHKELAHDDAGYRRALRLYRRRCLALTLLITLSSFGFPFLIHWALRDLPILITCIALFLIVLFAQVLLILGLAFGMQNFQNEKVGRVLQQEA